MNIIAEKLRQAYHNDLTDVPILLDGADEIDRLRAENERLLAEWTLQVETNDATFDENDRLRQAEAERDQWREAHDRVDHRAFALAQERDRLREALEKIAAKDFTLTDDGVRLPRRIAGPSAKIALAALASTANPMDQIGQSASWSAREP